MRASIPRRRERSVGRGRCTSNAPPRTRARRRRRPRRAHAPTGARSCAAKRDLPADGSDSTAAHAATTAPPRRTSMVRPRPASRGRARTHAPRIHELRRRRAGMPDESRHAADLRFVHDGLPGVEIRYCSGPSTSSGTATCTSSCSGTTPDLCGSVCVDNQTDQDHCGTSCAACTNQTCVAGACSGSCAPGQISCMGSVPQTCGPDGAWVAGTVTSGKCGAVCDPSATQCMGGTQQTCSAAGAWVTAAVVVGTCGAVCLPARPSA